MPQQHLHGRDGQKERVREEVADKKLLLWKQRDQ